MKDNILLKEKDQQIEYDFQYYIDRGNRRNSYIQIKEDKVIVKVPKFVSDRYITELINNKSNWILKNLSKYKTSIRKEKTYKTGETIYVLGKQYILNILKQDIKRSRIYINNNNVIVIIPSTISKYDEEDKVKLIVDKYYKLIAKEEVKSAMDDLTSRTGLYPSDITIKNLKATWGICSSKKHISINQNLMMFSRHSIEYVCLHELCHLKYMNHSQDFWQLVSKYMPDYKDAEKELKS